MATSKEQIEAIKSKILKISEMIKTATLSDSQRKSYLASIKSLQKTLKGLQGKTTRKSKETNKTWFSAYGQDIQEGVEPKLKGDKIYFYNPDGSYVWLDRDNDLAKKYAPQFYKDYSSEYKKTALDNKQAVDDGRISERRIKISGIEKEIYKDAGYTIEGNYAIYRGSDKKEEEPTEEPKETKEDIINWLKEQPEYKNLPENMQEDMLSYIDILGIEDIETQKRILESLELAKSQADPYFAEIIRMTTDELNRSMGTLTSDYETQQKTLQTNISQLEEDLSLGKERLSVDEQAELVRQQKSYETELEDTRTSMASTGLTFSSRRSLAETDLETEQGDIVESTKRSYQRQVEDLQTRASRGEQDAQDQLEEYKRLYGESVTSLGRGAESYLGTSGMPELKGYAPLGGVRGSIEEEKLSDIMTRAQSLSGLSNLNY